MLGILCVLKHLNFKILLLLMTMGSLIHITVVEAASVHSSSATEAASTVSSFEVEEVDNNTSSTEYLNNSSELDASTEQIASTVLDETEVENNTTSTQIERNWTESDTLAIPMSQHNFSNTEEILDLPTVLEVGENGIGNGSTTVDVLIDRTDDTIVMNTTLGLNEDFGNSTDYNETEDWITSPAFTENSTIEIADEFVLSHQEYYNVSNGTFGDEVFTVDLQDLNATSNLNSVQTMVDLSTGTTSTDISPIWVTISLPTVNSRESKPLSTAPPTFFTPPGNHTSTYATLQATSSSPGITCFDWEGNAIADGVKFTPTRDNLCLMCKCDAARFAEIDRRSPDTYMKNIQASLSCEQIACMVPNCSIPVEMEGVCCNLKCPAGGPNRNDIILPSVLELCATMCHKRHGNCKDATGLQKYIEEGHFKNHVEREVVEYALSLGTYGDGKLCYCKPGYRGKNCLQKCKSGKYSPYCLRTCPGGCAHGRCDPVDGTCSECRTGFRGHNCQKQEQRCRKLCPARYGKCKPRGYITGRKSEDTEHLHNNHDFNWREKRKTAGYKEYKDGKKYKPGDLDMVCYCRRGRSGKYCEHEMVEQSKGFAKVSGRFSLVNKGNGVHINDVTDQQYNELVEELKNYVVIAAKSASLSAPAHERTHRRLNTGRRVVIYLAMCLDCITFVVQRNNARRKLLLESLGSESIDVTFLITFPYRLHLEVDLVTFVNDLLTYFEEKFDSKVLPGYKVHQASETGVKSDVSEPRLTGSEGKNNPVFIGVFAFLSGFIFLMINLIIGVIVRRKKREKALNSDQDSSEESDEESTTGDEGRSGILTAWSNVGSRTGRDGEERAIGGRADDSSIVGVYTDDDVVMWTDAGNDQSLNHDNTWSRGHVALSQTQPTEQQGREAVQIGVTPARETDA